MKTLQGLKNTAADALAMCLEAGAEKASCSVSQGLLRELNVEDGKVNLMRSNFNSSLRLIVLRDGRKGTVSVNDLSPESIRRAAKDCVEAADAAKPDDANCIASLTENADFSEGIAECDEAALYDATMEYLDTVKSDYPLVTIENLISSYSRSESVLLNTNGVDYSERQGSYSISAGFSSSDGDDTTSLTGCGVDFLGFDKKLIELGDQRRVFDRCVKELGASPLGADGKFTGKMLMSPECAADLVGSAIGLFLSDGVIIDGTSPWRSKLGQKVASDKLTLSCIPHDSRIVCGERVHSDGYISEDFDYIKDGVLRSFDLSEYGARKTGGERAKASSSCIGIAPGETPLEDLIKGVDRGIYICRFSGGEPSVAGDISGVAKNSFLIENGRIARPLCETMVSFNIAEMVMNILDISKETVCDGSSVLPWVLADGVTVS
ncbi:MAG: TldD/PmbA family protein [Clostridia bacterium]|nr:TldD/PmbA family protein [Clostridia bacterium]